MRPIAISPTIRAALLLGALVLLLFFPLLFRGEVLSGGDLVNQYIPYKKLWKDELLSGRLPLWNPYTFGGRPHMADVQLGTFYPPNWLLLVLPVDAGFTFLAALHMWWGGIGMLLFLRRFGLGVWPALLGGVLFALGGYQGARLFPGIVFFIFAASWLPWAMLALWAIESGQAKRGAIALAFILTMQLFTGSPQVLYFTLLFTGLLFALRIVFELWAGRDPRYANDDFTTGPASWLPASRRWAAALAVAAALFLIMGSPQWPATLEFAAHTVERAEGASYRYATDGSVAPRYVLLNLVPHIFGPLGNEELYWGGREGFWEISCWMGAAPLLLACLALALLLAHWGRAGREAFDTYLWRMQSPPAPDASGPADGEAPFYLTPAHRLFLAAVILAWALGWLLALGANSPVYLVSYYALPFLNKFRVPGRFLLFHGLAISVLAPLALQLLIMPREPVARRRSLRLAAIVAAIFCAGYLALGLILNPLLDALGLRSIMPTLELIDALRESARLSWLQTIVVLVPAAIALLMWAARPALRPAALFILIGACALELLAYNWRAINASPRAQLTEQEYAYTEVVDFLAGRNHLGRFLCLDSVYAWVYDQNQMELFPNRPMMHGLFDARGYDPLYLGSYTHVISLASGLPPSGSKGAFLFVPEVAHPPLLSMLNVRTILTYEPLDSPFRLAKSISFPDGSTLLIYDNPGASGWASLVGVGAERPISPQLNTLAVDPGVVLRRAVVDAEDWEWLRQTLPPDEWRALAADLPPGARGQLELVARAPGRYEFRANVNAASLLVLAENVYPGWRVEVNGAPVELIRTNHTLIGAALPPGNHTIIVRYADRRIPFSALASLAAALLALAVLKSRHFEPAAW